MTRRRITPADRYAKVVEAFSDNPRVSAGSGKKGFGSSALKVNDKIFAMLASNGRFVVKLPKERVDALVASGSGTRFDPGHGRIMKEWLELPAASEDWISLAGEALSFVGGKKLK